MGVRFRGWGIGLPDKILTNDDLAQMMDTSDEWITERTGIRQRYVGGTARSLGVMAGREAMANAGVDPSEIDFLLLATTSADRLAPSTAAMIQADLGLTCPAMDINAACSGFVYGLRTAQGLMEVGTKKILLVGAENLSRWTDWTDRTTAILFGDGAGAVVLEADESGSDVISFILGTDGSAADILACEHGSTFTMDGREVFRRAVRAVVDSSEQAIAAAGLTPADIALVIPHQANIRIIQAVMDRLQLPMDQAVVTIDRYGNTSSASIPLAVYDAQQNNRIVPGDYALLTGFGAGMTWASSVVRWS